jgi:hypothetical protein
MPYFTIPVRLLNPIYLRWQVYLLETHHESVTVTHDKLFPNHCGRGRPKGTEYRYLPSAQHHPLSRASRPSPS